MFYYLFQSEYPLHLLLYPSPSKYFSLPLTSPSKPSPHQPTFMHLLGHAVNDAGVVDFLFEFSSRYWLHVIPTWRVKYIYCHSSSQVLNKRLFEVLHGVHDIEVLNQDLQRQEGRLSCVYTSDLQLSDWEVSVKTAGASLVPKVVCGFRDWPICDTISLMRVFFNAKRHYSHRLTTLKYELLLK